MKANLHILIFILVFAGCNDNKKDNNVKSSNTKEDWPFEDVADNFGSVSGTAISHKLSLSCDGEYLPVRKRILNKSELTMSNSGTEQARLLNDSIIIAYLYNDYPLELIDENEEYYKIRFDYKNQSLDGYILKNYCGSPTIKPYTDLSHSLRSYNLIINPDLLPYCRVFVTEKFHNLLVQASKSQNSLKQLKKVLSQTETERYCLYLDQANELYRYDIHHKEWEIKKVDVKSLNVNYKINEIDLNNREPDLTHYSEGIKVIAWKREKI